MRTRLREDSFTFKGRHMLALMIAFFGIVITVNVTMAVLANSYWTGLVVKNSYVASQGFNADLANADMQRKLGLSSEISYHNGLLEFTLVDSEGVSLVAEDLKAEIGRPAFEQADRTLAFKSGPSGRYTIPLTLQPGVWILRIHGETGGVRYRRDARLSVDNSGKGTVE